MANSANDANDVPSVTCVEAMTTPDGVLYSLVVITDWESFSSFVYRIEDMDEENELIYEFHGWIKGMWISESESIYLADDEGQIHENSSGKWIRTDTGVGVSLNMVLGFDDNRVFACGDNGSFVRKTNSGWESIDIGTNANLYAIHGVDDKGLYIVGADGTIVYLADGEPSALESQTNVDLIDVFAFSATNRVIVCSEDGLVLEGTGDGWQALVQDSEKTFYSVCEYDGKIMLGLGADGVVEYDNGELLEFRPSTPAYGLRATGRFLVVSGDNQVLRFDGDQWAGEAYGD